MPSSHLAPPLLARESFDAPVLYARSPPEIRHPNKQLVLEIAAAGRRPSAALTVARFSLATMPATLPAPEPTLTEIDGFLRYAAPPPGRADWHVNFADPDLFFAYGGAAFAQDEIQVAEHPLLASVREELLARPRGPLAPRTMEGGEPTPVLIGNVERWCSIDTDPELAMPYGIYGRRFHGARPEVVRQAVQRVDPPTRTNLLAMAAPACGSGPYTREDIEAIVATAFTGFAAARFESVAADGQLPRVVVHTGHWGTGAFGGNRVLMALLQLLAARLAGIDELVYYSVDADGAASVVEARRVAARVASQGVQVSRIVDAVLALGFCWGVSDGN